MKLAGAVVVAAAAGCLVARTALGNGAFPDSQAVITPADRPHEILLATNFGLITSTDDGGSWTWSCEQDPNGRRNLYQLGASPGRRLFARDSSGLVFTDDRGCRWTAATGALDGAVISDAFPDPNEAARVLAIAAPRGAGGGAYRLLESSDGGATFPIVRYTAAAGDTLSGVEIARADPATVYLIILKGADLAPALALSTDRGATWREHDLSGALGTGSVLLIAVDRDDPRRVFLQVNGPSANVLAVVEDGGTTVSTPLRLESGFMSGFLQTSGGAILVSGLVGADAVLHRSRDGGRSFASMPAPPTLWGFSERSGTIFGAARIGSPFAITTSTDEGTTWQPFMRYEDVGAIAGCVQDVCEDSCLTQAAVKLWPAQMCMPHSSEPGDASVVPEDAIGDATGGASEAAPERAPDGAAVDDGPAVVSMNDRARPAGCACSTSTAGSSGWWASAVLVGAWWRRRARRPHAFSRSKNCPR